MREKPGSLINTRSNAMSAVIVTWVYITSGLLLGWIAPKINTWLFPGFFSPMDKDAISAILSAIASGMIALTGIVFSLVFVIVQFGSATYSPRITRVFARSKVLSHALGVFTGTFLFALMALRATGLNRTDNIGGLAVWLAFIWLIASIAVLARLIRVFTTLTITNILTDLEKAGSESIAFAYDRPSHSQGRTPTAGQKQSSIEVQHHSQSEATTREPPQPHPFGSQANDYQIVRYTGRTAYLVGYRFDDLLRIAGASNGRIYFPNTAGDPVSQTKCIAMVQGNLDESLRDKITRSVIFASERNFRSDPKYALRLLVDIAIRALSPAINDPTTAVQSLDHLESLLHRIGLSKLSTDPLHDNSGTARVFFRWTSWEEYLYLSLLEILQYGASSTQVQRRLNALFGFLFESLPASRRSALQMLANERERFASEYFDSGFWQDISSVADPQGLGGGDHYCPASEFTRTFNK